MTDKNESHDQASLTDAASKINRIMNYQKIIAELSISPLDKQYSEVGTSKYNYEISVSIMSLWFAEFIELTPEEEKKCMTYKHFLEDLIKKPVYEYSLEIPFGDKQVRPKFNEGHYNGIIAISFDFQRLLKKLTEEYYPTPKRQSEERRES